MVYFAVRCGALIRRCVARFAVDFGAARWYSGVMANLTTNGDDEPLQAGPSGVIRRANGTIAPGSTPLRLGMRSPTVAQRRQIRADYVLRVVKHHHWQAIILNMVGIASDPHNRQAVAAATWISDRIAGPVGQHVTIDDSRADSPELRAQALRARLAELGLAGPQPVIDCAARPDDDDDDDDAQAMPTPERALSEAYLKAQREFELGE